MCCSLRTRWIKTDLHRNCSYEWNSQVTRTRTELVSVWTAAIEIHANSCLLEPVYGFKPHSSRTGRTVFSQLSAAVLRHKPNDSVVYTIRAWLSTILHCLQWYKLVLRTRLSTAAVQYPIIHTRTHARVYVNAPLSLEVKVVDLPASPLALE